MILRNLNKISNFHKTQHVYTKRKGIQENNDFAHKKSLLSVKQFAKFAVRRPKPEALKLYK